MKAIVTATAPTHYQTSSLRAFNFDLHNNNPYSSEIVGYSEFNTMKEARQFLRERAEKYYDGDNRAMLAHLSKWGLTLDACSATILTGFDREEFLQSNNRKY